MYVAGDPLNQTDSSGLCLEDACVGESIGLTELALTLATLVGIKIVLDFTVANQHVHVTPGIDLSGVGNQVHSTCTAVSDWYLDHFMFGSANQMDREAKRGQAPRDVTRVDKGKVKGEQDNVHFRDGSALNRDGTWKHGHRELTNDEKAWLRKHGWTVPTS